MGADPVTIGIKVGMMALQMGLTAMNKIEGPRLDSLDVTTADYGTPLERFWGIRRLEGRPIIWAEKLREKKSTSKGKSGKYKEYRYYGTFAIAVADQQIDKISRIWMDKHLVYDVTKAGPISVLSGFFLGLQGSPIKLSEGRNMRIYLGTEDQEPDPRIVQWCEDRYGPDSCPAYRGVSYIVFQEIPLEKFGNRIPQITVEAVSLSSPSRLFENIAAGAAIGPVFSQDGTRAIFYDTTDDDYAIWDVPTRTKIIQGTLPAHGEELQWDNQGRIWGLGDTLNSRLRVFSADGHTQLGSIDLGTFTEGLTVVNGDTGYVRPYAGVGSWIRRCTLSAVTEITLSFSPHRFFTGSDGTHWCVGMSGTNIHLYDISNSTDHVIASPGGATGTTGGFQNVDGDFVLFVDELAILVDEDTFTVLDTVATGATRVGPINPGAASFFTTGKEIDARTLETIQTFSLSSWTGANTDDQRYSSVLHALWGGSGSSTTIRYLDRITSGGVDLGDVVSDVADWCGIESVDVTDLDQLIYGYSVTQGAGKDILSPLLDIHDVDARPHDFSVQFIKRGDAALGTLAVTEFVREGDESRYQITIKQDTDLPATMFLNFADSDKDQQKNTVLPKRPASAVDSQRNLTIDLSTYVGTPGDMQKYADRYFRRRWNEREGVNLALTSQCLGLEPGDVYNLQLDDVTQSARLVKATISQGRINTEWVRDFPALTNLGTGTGAAMEGRDDDEIFIPATAKGFVLDIPLTDDAHDLAVPQMHYGAGSYDTGDFSGATIYIADPDENDYSPWNGVESADKAVWGYASDALDDANSNWLWDRGNSVNIQLFGGTLTTVTEAAIEADPTVNLAALKSGDDWELLNFTTATLESDGTYTLSGFKRGRRGTEWAATGHAAGDEFVLVSSLQRDGFGLSDLETSMSFRAEAIGRDYTTAPTIEVEFEGNTLQPYAPARFKWSTNGTDLTGTIYRRTRVGGAWSDSGSVPVSETSEAYEVDVLNGSAVVVRTITVSGTNTVTYTAAQIAADGFSVSSPPDVVVYQMSDTVGRGFPLAA